MTPTPAPQWRDVTIVNDLGLHARAAAKVAKAAQQATGSVWLQADAERVDASQVLDILTLGVGKGDRVRILVDASSDIEVLDRITALFADGFGE